MFFFLVCAPAVCLMCRVSVYRQYNDIKAHALIALIVFLCLFRLSVGTWAVSRSVVSGSQGMSWAV